MLEWRPKMNSSKDGERDGESENAVIEIVRSNAANQAD